MPILCLSSIACLQAADCTTDAGGGGAGGSAPQVLTKMLDDGSTALLLMNWNANASVSITADLGRCLGAGFRMGAPVAVTNLRPSLNSLWNETAAKDDEKEEATVVDTFTARNVAPHGATPSLSQPALACLLACLLPAFVEPSAAPPPRVQRSMRPHTVAAAVTLTLTTASCGCGCAGAPSRRSRFRAPHPADL